VRIERGDVYRVAIRGEDGAVRPVIHPCVVIQDSVINGSRIPVIAVCGISTNMKRLTEPGNVLLEPGEGNLPKRSIVRVSQVSAALRSDFSDYIGHLDDARMADIFAGMGFIQSFGS